MSDGAFGLASPADLLAKLQHDHGVLAAAPNAPYAAFNFFVTAEHMIDWLYPGRRNKEQREAVRGSEPALALVSHLASGAKHFKELSPHHDSVKGSGIRGGYFSTAYFPPDYWGDFFGGGRILAIDLDGQAAIKYGPSISVIELASVVRAYWEEPGRDFMITTELPNKQSLQTPQTLLEGAHALRHVRQL